MRESPLARILFAVFAALTVYASLYPMEGWRGTGVSPFAYLTAPWPRHITSFDVVVNVLGYIPYGFLGAAALQPRLRGARAFIAATASAAALSLILEALQSYLPARIASNLDAICNVLGAAIGAAAAVRYGPSLFEEGAFARARNRAFLRGGAIDLGLALMGLWLFIQLNPTSLLFGAGDLRELLGTREPRGERPAFFITIEALTSAANLTAAGLLLSCLASSAAAVRVQIVALAAAALVVRAAAFAILMRAENVLAWLTHGAQIGLAVGVAVALGVVALPRGVRMMLAALLIMAATVLVNLVPPNPYLAASLKVWQQGHFLNFNGLTRLVSALWPFAALGYLMYLAGSRPRDAE
ncbi:MAG TPA: VanZ family protein [Burkholderiales bacterium]|jgi:VanZ family protein